MIDLLNYLVGKISNEKRSVPHIQGTRQAIVVGVLEKITVSVEKGIVIINILGGQSCCLSASSVYIFICPYLDWTHYGMVLSVCPPIRLTIVYVLTKDVPVMIISFLDTKHMGTCLSTLSKPSISPHWIVSLWLSNRLPYLEHSRGHLPG